MTANVYAFVRYLSSSLPENSLMAVSNGASDEIISESVDAFMNALPVLLKTQLQVV